MFPSAMSPSGRVNTGDGGSRKAVYGDILSYLERNGADRPVKVRQISVFVRARRAARLGVSKAEVNLLELHGDVTKTYLRRLDRMGLIDYSPRRGIVRLKARPETLDRFPEN